MAILLRCGPLSAEDGEGRELYASVTVSLDEENLTVLEGPSGGGKSTLLRQVAGLAPAKRVTRELGGRRWGENELPDWRSQVTLLMQDAPVIPGSVLENLSFPYLLGSAGGRAFDNERAGRLLEEVGLGTIAIDRPASTLSGGERHRLALVRALLWEAPVLLADEPLSGLDGPRASRCFDLLREHARRPGHAVLCVLHDPSMGRATDRRLCLEPEGLTAK
ncbi:MAG: ATP-binding cassette domain-containing protein [Acidobacteria bacterium]|nr:ATP-binding cassette domain-containing protein [Acidobacteriota bacterium]